MATATSVKEAFSPPATIQRSPWHSPVPYLFGGLAAMLGLIAFALLILACSYWKLSTREEAREEDEESGSGEKAMPVFEEKFLVIMAGEVKPTFLATPVSSRTTSFNDEKVELKEEDDNNMKKNKVENGEEEAVDDSGFQSSQEQNHSNLS